MSAAEVIEQIKKLTPEELSEVRSCLDRLCETVKKVGSLENAGAATSAAKSIPSDEFKAIAAEVFDKNEELFRKLAQ